MVESINANKTIKQIRRGLSIYRTGRSPFWHARIYDPVKKKFDTYLLSTAPWENSSAWADKNEWVKRYMGKSAYKRLIISQNKHLNIGDYLIDDRTANGVGQFRGEYIHFGSEKFPDWNSVLAYLL